MKLAASGTHSLLGLQQRSRCSALCAGHTPCTQLLLARAAHVPRTPRVAPTAGPPQRRVSTKVAYTDRNTSTHSLGYFDAGMLDHNDDWVGRVREQGRLLASEILALKEEAEKKMARLTSNWQAEQQLVARLRTELDNARSEVDVLQREAAASAKLRDELAARTAALAATRDRMLDLETQRTEELQASMMRYAELEDALAVADQSIDSVADADVAAVLEARVTELEGELTDAANLAARLTAELHTAQRAREEAERAQHEAAEQAHRAQAEAEALAQRLQDQKGEVAYRARVVAEEEGVEMRYEFEMSVAQREAAVLQAAVRDMKEQVEELRNAAAKGGSQAGLFRQRAQKLQAQLTQHLFKADEAAKRVQQLEAAYSKPAVAGAALVSRDEPIIINTKQAKQQEVMQKAAARLEQLEAQVMRAMSDCDMATNALAGALQSQHRAEQAQAAVEAQLRHQVARVSALEAALSDQAAAAQAAAEREQQLEWQLGQQAQRADEAARRAQILETKLRDQIAAAEVAAGRISQLEGELFEQTSLAVAAANRALELEDRLGEQMARAGRAEERAQELQAALHSEWGKSVLTAQKLQHAEARIEALCASEARLSATGKLEHATKLELRAQLEEERVRWTQLEGELNHVRREYERCERELESVEMQALRAQQAAEHNLRLLANAQDQLFAVQGQLDSATSELEVVKAQLEMATAELEQLRATDQRRVAELVAAKENAKSLNLEITRLHSQLAERDTDVMRWQREAEEATQLAQTAVQAKERALEMMDSLQSQLARVGGASAPAGAASGQAASSGEMSDAMKASQVFALRQQLQASQAQSEAMRKELATARAELLAAERMNVELQEQADADIADLQEHLEKAEASAMKMGQQLLGLMKEKENAASAAAARATNKIMRTRSAGASMDEDYISEEEVDGLLTELDSTRAELTEALRFAEEVTKQAEAAESRAAALQAQLEAAACQTEEAEGHVARLRQQLELLMAPAAAGAGAEGEDVQGLMLELNAAKAAAKAAEDAARCLAEEKNAIMRELVFGQAAMSKAAAGSYLPGFQINNVTTWRQAMAAP